ncbi:MAG: hypothetical protein KHX55_02550 [Proteobacteria bacterium]|nr:hypothetical protein [Pseudomonadota bacterium]
MTSLLLTPDWDLQLDDMGNIATVTGGLQTAQDVATSCRVWKGEALYDTERGVPYKEDIFAQRPNLSLLQADFETEAKRIKGVASVEVVAESFIDRKLVPDIRIALENGEEYNV